MRLLLFLSGAILCLVFGSAHAVDLQPGRGVADLGPHLTFHSEPQANLATVLQRFRDGAFSDDLQASMLDNNYAPEAWAATEIVNATIDDGRAPDRFVLTLSLAVASAVDVYIVRDSGFTESLLNYSAFDPFNPEDHSVTRLRTVAFDIAPQEVIALLVNFKFGPIQSFHMALETPSELEASAFASGVGHTAFYAFCISCLVFFFGFHVAMKNWIGVLYALLFSVALAFIAYVDGLLFRFVYPDDPACHSTVGFGLLYALSGVGFVVAGRSAVSDGKESRISLAISSLALLSLGGFVASLFSPGTYVALFAYVLLALMLASSFIASVEWRKRDGDIQLGALWITGLSVVAVVAVVILATVGLARETILVPNAIKAIFSVLLLADMTSLTAHVIHLRWRHARAVEAQIAALEGEAKRSQELLVAEKNYSRARELAGLRQRQLASASHDLKQPIASLRMTFDSIAEQVDPKLRTRLREAFDYMEALSGDYLKNTGPDADVVEDIQSGEGEGSLRADPADDQTEVYELSIILGTVYQMFHEEAVSKGLDLRLVNSTAHVSVPPIVLMRIVSNLVSNAVKYTLEGSVLIGVRIAAGNAVLWVVDTGPGMDDDEIERYRAAYQKGEASSGHGLGMAVCFQLAQQHQLNLSVTSSRGRGTTFALSIPRV